MFTLSLGDGFFFFNQLGNFGSYYPASGSGHILISIATDGNRAFLIYDSACCAFLKPLKIRIGAIDTRQIFKLAPIL